ncbi:MAG: arylsulfatase [Planctomycetaceae bacterium]|nr:arylsulfatase [Planctomycetaceae bacterium]
MHAAARFSLLAALAAGCSGRAPVAPAPVQREIACPVAPAPAARPNIVLIFADDLGFGELGCYGQTKIATPHIDRLAGEGARFTQFYTAAPVCAPARSALLTGQHLGHTPNRDNSEVQPEGQGPLPEGTRTLAHDLKSVGYATACIGKWGLGFVGSTGDPNAMGFDLFFGYNCQRQAWSYYPTHLWRNAEKVVLEGNDPKGHAPTGRSETTYACDLLLAEATAFIERSKDGPFYLAYQSPLPHLALQMPPEVLARYEGRFEETPYVGGKGYTPHPTPRAAYAAMISRLDAEVGAIRAALEKAGVADNTLIFLTSDNGPTHDVGGVDTVFFDSTAGLRGRKGSVYEGGVRVPGIACWPGRIPADRTIDTPAWTVDFRATFGALAGVPTQPTDGVDLVPLLLEGRAPDRAFLYWPFPGYGGQEAVRSGDWKIVRAGLRQRKAAAADLEGWQLFNLARDPNETTDLAAAHPEIVDRLAAIAAREYVPSERFPLR